MCLNHKKVSVYSCSACVIKDVRQFDSPLGFRNSSFVPLSPLWVGNWRKIDLNKSCNFTLARVSPKAHIYYPKGWAWPLSTITFLNDSPCLEKITCNTFLFQRKLYPPSYKAFSVPSLSHTLKSHSFLAPNLWSLGENLTLTYLWARKCPYLFDFFPSATVLPPFFFSNQRLGKLPEFNDGLVFFFLSLNKQKKDHPNISVRKGNYRSTESLSYFKCITYLPLKM